MPTDTQGAPSPRSVPVTVVMMTRNRRAATLRSLDELRALPEAPPVVVVDNGSEDGTAEAVERSRPDVTVIRAGRNLGAPARTLGVRAARTPYVAFADDDSWWAPGALERAVARFEAAPRLGLLAARILVGPERRLDPACEVMAASPLRRPSRLPGPAVLGFVACGAVVRRAAYLEVGGFSPVIFFLGEEAVLAQDLAAAGWDLAYVDDVVAVHHPSLGGDRPARRRLEQRNALLSMVLRRPWRRVAQECVRLTASGDRERSALRDAVRRAPMAVAARRRLPRHVERQVRLLELSPR